MENNNNKKGGGITLAHFTLVAFVWGCVLVTLKSLGLTSFTWQQAFAPMWIPALAYVITLFVTSFVAVVVNLTKKQ